MSPQEIQQIAAQCTRFLNGHLPRSVQDLLRSIAESPLAQMRNDQYGRGGFVSEFEAEIAALLGQEAAVFMPSGTMAQPIALRIWSDQLEIPTVAFHPTCHLQLHEHLAYQALHRLDAVLLGDADRLFTLEDLQAVSQPLATLLIELPQREIGGQLPTWEELVTICNDARERGIKLHLDGARLWECGPYYGRSYAEVAGLFDSVYVSFYKILGGLPGAILAGPEAFIQEAKIWQRRQGGNLQQQSPSAISAKLGLDEHLPKIGDYVAKAAEIADALRPFEQIKIVPEHPPTNMMHLYLEGNPEKLQAAALQMATESKTALFFGAPANGKLEINVGSGALKIERDEVATLFTRLFELAESA